MNKKNSKLEQSLMFDLCSYIEANSDKALSLEHMAKQAQLSPAHLQKRFKAVIGVSPKEYQETYKLKNLKQNLRKNNSVTEAIYDAGFSSSSRVYEKLDKKFGMTPKQYRANGAGIAISYGEIKTSIGIVLIGATDRGICFLQFRDKKDEVLKDLYEEFPNAEIIPMDNTYKDQFAGWAKQIKAYIKGESVKFDLPLDLQGTVLQMKVWKYLQTIPSGTVKSYKQVAAAIGKPKAIRAVASACGRNNVSIIIPCHRVLRGNGELAGYRWGLEYKKKLLELEKITLSLL